MFCHYLTVQLWVWQEMWRDASSFVLILRSRYAAESPVAAFYLESDSLVCCNWKVRNGRADLLKNLGWGDQEWKVTEAQGLSLDCGGKWITSIHDSSSLISIPQASDVSVLCSLILHSVKTTGPPPIFHPWEGTWNLICVVQAGSGSRSRAQGDFRADRRVEFTPAAASLELWSGQSQQIRSRSRLCGPPRPWYQLLQQNRWYGKSLEPRVPWNWWWACT